ncbi:MULTISPECIES: hypothetical protein [Halomonadaceae]|uniref:Uncharacterized protein n=1 Tax=Vreelandella halophila TaxID=86177 RepID=A0A9X5B4H1_9GAMM|nr:MULTISPECIES: hypothetical protein [Halomonas]MYL26501.1 hypothetical protein [Halomonas utahensis]MYL73838.1 hypothetical protein [Halomonas sp. 22501_18_FS]
MKPIFVSDDTFLKGQDVIIDNLIDNLWFFVDTVSGLKDKLYSFGVWNYGFCFNRSLELNHEVSKRMWSEDVSDKHMLALTLEDRTDGIFEDEESDYYLDGKHVRGFGVAVENGQFLVRVGGALNRVEVVEGDKFVLDEKEGVLEYRVFCRSVSAGNEEISDCVRNVVLNRISNGEEIWNFRRILFPRVRFLEHVKAELIELQSNDVRGVKQELWFIDELVKKWQRDGGAIPSTGGRITPEHEARKRLCYFWDEHRWAERCFDYHARYTPSPGRIHLKFEDVEEKSAVIAYIGSKL